MTETERPKTEFLSFPLKVIVSPFRAFKEIAQKPDIKGIVLIAGLCLLGTAGLYYAYSAKVFYDVDGTLTSFLSSDGFSGFMASVLYQEVIIFAFNWLIHSAVLFLVMRGFGQREGSWRVLFTLVGYAFSIMIVRSAVSALLVATLPEIQFSSLSTWPPSTEDEIAVANTGIQDHWGSMLAFQVLNFLNFYYVNIFDIWLVILSVIIVCTYTEVAWGKAAMISVTAFTLRFFLKTFLGV